MGPDMIFSDVCDLLPCVVGSQEARELPRWAAGDKPRWQHARHSQHCSKKACATLSGDKNRIRATLAAPLPTKYLQEGKIQCEPVKA